MSRWEIRTKRGGAPFTVGAAGVLAALAVGGASAPAAEPQAAGGASGRQIEVELCDGETAVVVPADEAATRERGRQIADELMQIWKRKHPEADWVEAETAKHQVLEPHGNEDLIGKPQGQTYGRTTERDVLVWRNETYKLAVAGSAIFHSADELGSEIAVSCDMCHPDASNTHPETYPKYQVQLGRVALLRDMINWCIEHPVRGERLDADDPKMRALETYIYAQRQGKALQYGKR